MEAQWEQAIQTRLIRIPADKLLAGDPRYNIIIKPGDTIHVPVDLIGEFSIMGNVNRSGYDQSHGPADDVEDGDCRGRRAGAAGVAEERRGDPTDRHEREEIVMVDLDKIANGEQPDFFIKPNDLINVGTDIDVALAGGPAECVPGHLWLRLRVRPEFRRYRLMAKGFPWLH